MILFHNGCCGCTQQQKHSTDFCFDCCFFESDWNKPDLNSAPGPYKAYPANLERRRVISRRKETLGRTEATSIHAYPVTTSEEIIEILRQLPSDS
jgi:hypothetical protein